MKKNLWKIILIAVIAVMVFAGCKADAVTNSPSPSPAADETVADLLPFSVVINYGASSVTFTNADLANLTIVDFSTEQLKDNAYLVRNWKGVSFQSLFTLKGVNTTDMDYFTFTSIKPSPSADPFVQMDKTDSPLSSYYFALFEQNEDDIQYVCYNIEIMNSENIAEMACGIRTISTAQSYSTYWVKGVAAVDITYIQPE